MLSGVERRGAVVARTAADRARRRVADALRAELPGVAVTVEGEGANGRVVLTGRIALDDVRLRWIGSLLR